MLHRYTVTKDTTMKQYKYKLDPSSKKFQCPSCGKNSFVRFIETATGAYVSGDYGRCDREQKCGYYSYPSIEKKEDNSWQFASSVTNVTRKHAGTTVTPLHIFINETEAAASIGKANSLNDYLLTVFDAATVETLIQRYRIGASRCWPGATVFFYVDAEGRYRRGKVMLYDALSGKRKKNEDEKAFITSVHALKGLADKKPPECLFGLHLAAETNKPIAIVESEKTAIIASVFVPNFIWLATGYKKGLKPELIEPIKYRQIVLFPDLGAYDEWKAKAAAISPAIKVSDYLERNANDSERVAGLDIADYLLMNGYPPEWDLPCERNPENDFWRTVNALENMEGLFIKNDKIQINKHLEMLERIYTLGEIPEALFQKHAPSTWASIN